MPELSPPSFPQPLAEHPLEEGTSQPFSTPTPPPLRATAPGGPVICRVVLPIVQRAILIQGAGNDQTEFVTWEETAKEWCEGTARAMALTVAAAAQLQQGIALVSLL